MERLKNNKEFQRVYQGGRYFAHPYMVLYVFKSSAQQSSRLGFAVGKKVGNAVMRNRLRRKLKEICRLNEDSLTAFGTDMILLGRPKGLEASYQELQEGFIQIAGRATSWLRKQGKER